MHILVFFMPCGFTDRCLWGALNRIFEFRNSIWQYDLWIWPEIDFQVILLINKDFSISFKCPFYIALFSGIFGYQKNVRKRSYGMLVAKWSGVVAMISPIKLARTQKPLLLGRAKTSTTKTTKYQYYQDGLIGKITVCMITSIKLISITFWITKVTSILRTTEPISKLVIKALYIWC